ncbi:MAG: 2-dehydropantoate 2-reductase [Caldilineaceae bacterium]|nr:2-dehydropantoate 2-reductase [Caldilineaceae bacterium]MCB0109605.1 2-dehydropantoate 2-reductase [Caldilineaceae bacterium]MCB0143551.1 2-dehydropantoate 2-reductase [Caldilineaceae bacterium]
MRIAVFGTGGVGGNFGGLLARVGHDVAFIARGEHLQAMHQSGLKISTNEDEFVIQPVWATDDPVEIGEVDVVLVCVKAWQVEQAALAIRPMVGPDTMVVTLQNGVEAPEQLSQVLGPSHVLGGLCLTFSYIVEPGHVRAGGGSIQFGELDNRKSERVSKLREVFESTGVNVSVPEHIHAALWQKFLMINAFSGIGSITRAPAAVWRNLPETREMFEQVSQEVLAVAKAKHIPVAETAIDEAASLMDRVPSNFRASMQRDIMNGQRSELEFQNGAVVRFAQELGVAAPVNTFIYQSLLPLELQAQGKLEFPS